MSLQESVPSLDQFSCDGMSDNEGGNPDCADSFGSCGSGVSFEDPTNKTHSSSQIIHCPPGASSVAHIPSEYSVPSQDAAD